MKKTVIIFAILFSCGLFQKLHAQREVMFAHYKYNLQEINPGYVGSRASMSIISLNRSHWTLVFDKAPVTQSLNVHSPTNNENIGLGISFRNERFGPEKTTSFFADFSYRVQATHQGTLSFGIKAGMGLYDVPLTELIIDDPRDPHFASDYRSHWLPNFGFGMYYREENLYIGVSIPKFLEVNYFDNSLTGGARTILQERNYYLTAGAAFEINPDMVIVPTTYMRYQRDAKGNGGPVIEADLSANIILFDRFSAGAMVRLQDAFGLMLGLRVSDNWTLNYSFDWSILNRVPSFNFGSHELVLRYDLNFLYTHRPNVPMYF